MTSNKISKITLPMRDGVSANQVWLPVGDWSTVLAFLAQRFPDISAARWRERMIRGDVLDQQGCAVDPASHYQSGTRLYYYRELESEQAIPFAEIIIYQDEHIIVVDKPHFLPIAPSGRYLKETLLARLKNKLAMDHLVPLHRLDRETAGLVIFSKNIATRDAYHALFRQHKISKTYHALAPYNAQNKYPLTYRSRITEADDFYRRQEIAGEPNAESIIDVIEIRGDMAVYKLMPVSGKTHQLRVHMAALGMAIVNDPYYPELTEWKGDDFSFPLQLLAKSIYFIDPITGLEQCFSSKKNL